MLISELSSNLLLSQQESIFHKISHYSFNAHEVDVKIFITWTEVLTGTCEVGGLLQQNLKYHSELLSICTNTNSMETLFRCLPGHSVLQVLFCTDMPSQKAPPLRGAGFVQVRERFCTPRPQRTLQGDQSVHDDQPPFTVWAKGPRERCEQTLQEWKLVFTLWLTISFLSRKTAPQWLHHTGSLKSDNELLIKKKE